MQLRLLASILAFWSSSSSSSSPPSSLSSPFVAGGSSPSALVAEILAAPSTERDNRRSLLLRQSALSFHHAAASHRLRNRGGSIVDADDHSNSNNNRNDNDRILRSASEKPCLNGPTQRQLPHALDGTCNRTRSGHFCRYECSAGHEPSQSQGYIACCNGEWILPDGAKCSNVHAPKMVQFNVDEGGGDRLLNILTWLRDQRAGVAGLCELNGWTPETMAQRANLSGFANSHLFQIPSGYHLGFMADKPIRVVTEQSTGFERGMLHVEVADCHYIVVHLHAHSATKRVDEAELVAGTVTEILNEDPQACVVVSGDFNTLSKRDEERHVQEGLLEKLKTSTHLWEKFTINGSIAYEPLETLVAAGLHEVCDRVPSDTSSTSNSTSTLPWSEQSCQSTEPTKVAYDMTYGEPVDMRLDFVLMSSGCVEWARRTKAKADRGDNQSTPIVAAPAPAPAPAPAHPNSAHNAGGKARLPSRKLLNHRTLLSKVTSKKHVKRPVCTDDDDFDEAWASVPDIVSGATCGDGKPWLNGYIQANFLDARGNRSDHELLLYAMEHCDTIAKTGGRVCRGIMFDHGDNPSSAYACDRHYRFCLSKAPRSETSSKLSSFSAFTRQCIPASYNSTASAASSGMMDMGHADDNSTNQTVGTNHSQRKSSKQLTEMQINCTVVRDATTDYLSDHYPVLCHWSSTNRSSN